MIKKLHLLAISCMLVLLLCNSCKKDSSDTNNNTTNTGYDYHATGSSGHDLLSSGTYQSITFEIHYMPGYAPEAGVMDAVKTYLLNYCNKPSSITVKQSQIASNGGITMNVTTVSQFEKTVRQTFTAGSDLVIHMLITDGQYNDSNVLGVAYYNTSLCLFGKVIHDNSGGLGQISRATLESTVLEHELGHLLGLVNLGTTPQSQHEDTAHAKHCNNKKCLMYYASETMDLMGTITGSEIPTLDAACHTDLQKNGGK